MHRSLFKKTGFLSVMNNRKVGIHVERIITNIVNITNLCWLVDSPTRMFGFSATVIDNVVTNITLNEVYLETLQTSVTNHYGHRLILEDCSIKNLVLKKKKFQS